MSVQAWVQLFLLIGILLCLIPLLGNHMARVFTGQATFLHPLLGWLESLCYRVGGVDPEEEMAWTEYAKALFYFNVLGFVALLFLQFAQPILPLNPQDLPAVAWPLAFNTAISFVTNTNWQAYAGETTMSYLTQMTGLTVQNFLSAATGMAVLLALIRGIAKKNEHTIGNFWADLVRCIVYLLLPLSIILALLLVSEGVVQTFSPYIEVTTLEQEHQIIPIGPAASQIAIKQLGTNGGGFFNANSAHPFENPSGFSNFLEALAILLIPASLTYTYGCLVGAKKHGWLLCLAMFIVWGAGLAISIYSEQLHNPVLGAFPLWEGKEIRLGITNSMVWAVSTSATSNGSVNSMLSSLSPLAGGVAMFNIMLGESIFGGVGTGLCAMIMFVLLTVFLSGLMVGRTPEYLGKKLEKREIQWLMAAVLIPGTLILMGAGISSVLPIATGRLLHEGPHGLSEILYAFSSSAGNNGSAFAGLQADTPYYNLTLATIILISRVSILLPSLAIAGLLARKKLVPPSAGTFTVDTPLFLMLLICIILFVGALSFFPALSLGPIVEHMLMLDGRSF